MDLTNKILRLPDVYAKSRGSNNCKFLELLCKSKIDLKGVLDDIRDASSVETATGSALDVIGSIYGVFREGMTDEAYRIAIQLEIMRSMIQPDYTSIFSALLKIFGASSSELAISNTENPFEYRFDAFPIDVVTRAGMTIDTATDLVNRIVPITGIFTEINYTTSPASVSIYAGAAVGTMKKQVLTAS